jgi:uncharacterized membrane protein YjfL (UPF0719 family)
MTITFILIGIVIGGLCCILFILIKNWINNYKERKEIRNYLKSKH